MASSSTQHRCVFVGNIPYDATEEQLIEICREVGPVVSFRLVIDRETGRPKGYGFCEYKDEETALSARRNLQGYEINGRQLRVDFAENDKNADRNREQGRGGPGLAANSDSQKQIGGPAILSESTQHQPIGLHIAITAASIMSGALGGLQSARQASPNGQPVPANDPITLHLAKMSRSQLNGIISDLKVMATQNRELARQLLLAKPQLSKALFQAQIMLGMVSQQVLQMPNIWQVPSQAAPPLCQDAQLVQQSAVQTLPGVPPLVQKVPLGPLSSLPQNSLVQNQYSAPPQPPLQQRTQISQQANSHIPQATQPGQSGVPLIPSLNSSIRPQIQVASSSLNQQMQQPSLIHHSAQSGAANFGQNSLKILPNTAIQSTLISRPLTTNTTFQSGPSETSGISDAVSRDADSKARALQDSTLSRRSNAYLNLQTSTLPDPKEMVTRPSKLLKVDDGRNMSSTMGILNVSRTSGSGPAQTFASGSWSVNPLPKPEELQHSEKQISQVQLPSDVESALLQQVLNLTPEQLSSLPPDQRQQVIQLQNALRRIDRGPGSSLFVVKTAGTILPKWEK